MHLLSHRIQHKYLDEAIYALSASSSDIFSRIASCSLNIVYPLGFPAIYL
jgi:hypothetical protein